jgi:hypothetical protein
MYIRAREFYCEESFPFYYTLSTITYAAEPHLWLKLDTGSTACRSWQYATKHELSK